MDGKSNTNDFGYGLYPPSRMTALGFNRVVLAVVRSLPLYANKQTSSEPAGMSQTCHEWNGPVD